MNESQKSLIVHLLGNEWYDRNYQAPDFIERVIIELILVLGKRNAQYIKSINNIMTDDQKKKYRELMDAFIGVNIPEKYKDSIAHAIEEIKEIPEHLLQLKEKRKMMMEGYRENKRNGREKEALSCLNAAKAYEVEYGQARDLL